jgi:hypothetical protein
MDDAASGVSGMEDEEAVRVPEAHGTIAAA